MKEPTRRQLQALNFVALLSPATRLLPGAAARAAGHSGWACPILAIPLCALLCLATSRALAGKLDGEGLGEVIVRRFPHFGRVFLGVYALWLALYAGFAVRSAASRFVYTIYTGASPWPFVAAGLSLGLLAALGSVRQLARTAEIFRPLLILTLLPIIGVGLAQSDFVQLVPTPDELPGLAEGTLTALGTVAFALVNVPVLETGPRIVRRARTMSLWSARECLFLAALCAATLGLFGPELTGSLTYPFFALVRNTGLFGVAERIEALVTALWVLSDFALAALSLMSAARLLSLSLGIRPASEAHGVAGARAGDCSALRRAVCRLLTPRTLLTLACAALALCCALAVAPDSRTLRAVSDYGVVYVNGAACAAMTAVCALCARRG